MPQIAQQQRVTHYHAPHFDYALSNEQWYLSYAQFKGQLLPHLDVADYPTPAADDTRRPRSSLSVLVVGCGNSALSKELFDDGFTDLHSIDYSEVVVDKMSQTYHDTPELKCQCKQNHPTSHQRSAEQYRVPHVHLLPRPRLTYGCCAAAAAMCVCYQFL